MPVALTPVPVPLRLDADGVIRVGGTRVTLDTIVQAYQEGATAEEVAQQYPVPLSDVYATFSFYLARKAEVDQYLSQRDAMSVRAREHSRSRSDCSDFRNRLLARHNRAAALP